MNIQAKLVPASSAEPVEVMTCPRCRSTLEERLRDGVVIDVCLACRGIWLDRGELGQLIERERREPARLEPHSSRYTDDDGDDRDRRAPAHRRPWLESLRDIFD